MARQQTLDLFIEVRILAGQQIQAITHVGVAGGWIIGGLIPAFLHPSNTLGD
jgi:hypothetical protein